MNFVSVNECDKFAYRDSRINKVNMSDSGITLEVEALIVRRDNSQNSNYTDSYAGDTNIILRAANIDRIIKLGYRKYDANDSLLEEVEDEVVDIPDSELNYMMTGAYLTGISENEDTSLTIGIEIPDEDPSAVTDEYEIIIKTDELRVEWDKYLNRVQEY